jgi:hypothetical protein
MNRGTAAYLAGILGITSSLLCTSCGEDGQMQAYQCTDEIGAVVGDTIFVGKGKDVYFGTLEDQTNGSCAREWHFVSVGGGSQYECRTSDGHSNVKVSKTQPIVDPWTNGSCADIGHPTTPAITDISGSGLVKWIASQSNIAGNQDGPPEGYNIVTSTMPISDALFKDKVKNSDYQFVSATSNPTESFQLNLGQGNYYIRIQAENNNESQVSALSPPKSFSIESHGISIYPNPIARSGITRARLTLGSNYTGDFSDLTLKVNGSTVEVKQDYVSKNIFYFTPPTPSSNGALDIHISSSGTGNIDIGNAISVTADNIEQTNAVLQGNLVDVEEAYSDVKSAGLTGSEAQETFIETAYGYAQLATDILQNLWLAEVTGDRTQVDYVLQSHISESQDLVDKLYKTLGPITVTPVAKKAANLPEFGRFGWFADVKKILDPGIPYYTEIDGSAIFIAVKADAYNLRTYVNQTAGNTITEAVAANQDARLVVNGGAFGYKRRDGTHPEPLISAGIVINGGQVQPTSCAEIIPQPTEGCEQLAKWRWWFGQLYDGSYKHGGRLKSGPKQLAQSGHPPLPHNPPMSTDLKAGIGGLYIYITDKTTSPDNPNPRSHIVTGDEDRDLVVFQSVRGKDGGWGGIAYDKETNILVIFSKAAGNYQGLSEATQKLFDMGTDWCIGTDGGSSSALALKTETDNQFIYPVRSMGRHNDSKRPTEGNTVTNYFVLVPK